MPQKPRARSPLTAPWFRAPGRSRRHLPGPVDPLRHVPRVGVPQGFRQPSSGKDWYATGRRKRRMAAVPTEVVADVVAGYGPPWCWA